MIAVSVVIPFYNQERYLRQCLESVLRQTVRNIEVIIVDDGSEEDPRDVVESLGDDRIRLIEQANAGVAAARNAAIRESSGEFLTFLDADDWVAEAMIEKLMCAIVSSSDCAMAYSDIIHVDDGGEPCDSYEIASARTGLSGNILPALLLGGYFPPCCVMARTSIVRALGGFDPELAGCCDWDLWIRMALTGWKAEFFRDKLAYYRRYAGSMSTNAAHMRETAIATLRKNMASSPGLMAGALQDLFDFCAVLYSEKLRYEKELARLEAEIAGVSMVGRERDRLCVGEIEAT